MKKIFLICTTTAILILTTACGTSAPFVTPTPASAQLTAAANGTEVIITLADNTITSSVVTFKAGIPYTFVIENSGHHTHNFNINAPVSVAGSLDAALSGALLSVGRDKLSAGASTSVEFTFPASAVGQKLEFSCLIKSHYEDGMYLVITVTN